MWRPRVCSRRTKRQDARPRAAAGAQAPEHAVSIASGQTCMACSETAGNFYASSYSSWTVSRRTCEVALGIASLLLVTGCTQRTPESTPSTATRTGATAAAESGPSADVTCRGRFPNMVRAGATTVGAIRFFGLRPVSPPPQPLDRYSDGRLLMRSTHPCEATPAHG